MMKMQVLIAYPFTSEIRNNEQMIYLPELVQDESSLQVAIREHHPQVLIVGNNAVGCETLQLWRQVMGNDIQLTIIRRGSSLSRIDIDRAKQLNINVLNTLSVNSRFVAEYMIEQLHLPNNGISSRIGIIGSGAIGSRIAYRLKTSKHHVNIYSPSLIDPDEYNRKTSRKRKGIDIPDINISMKAEDAVEDATHVILAIDADKVKDVKEQLSKEFFQIIPNGARIVSVTEFRVFANGALEILLQRIRKGELTARLDSPAFDLSTIKDHPIGLEAVSAAMKGPGCGEAMDQAVLVVLSNLALEQTSKSPLTFSINTKDKNDITIIGAGITGLITAFFLCENGYTVEIIDEHHRPHLQNNSNENELSSRGTTLDGCDARHASVTETMPQAVFYRKDSLGKYPLDHGGWRIISGSFNNQETAWIDKFSELAGYPELVINLINPFIANLNRRGIELWEDIFRLYPNIAQNAVKNRQIIRVCPSGALFNAVSSFQTKYHQNEGNLSRLNHAELLQRIPALVLTDGDAGGIEVPGFTVNHLQLCLNIIQYLETKTNVHFKWSTMIQSINDIFSSKIIFASSLNGNDIPFLSTISSSIQGVLGCWIQIPNVHSIKNGFKIMEKDPIGVINITPSCDDQHLYITGGFAFCGHRGVVRSSYLDQLNDLFYSKIRSYLPEEIEAYENEMRQTRYCIRPMTPDGMPIIAKLNNDENKKQEIYFIGGSNAGGFVQSPILATLILDLIQGPTNETNLCHIYRSLRLDRNTLLCN